MMSPREAMSLRSHNWEVSYKTSAQRPDGTSVDILHDFYIPVLRRSVRYDRVAGYFRSSSLAAASQGFSAFVGNQGRIRLVVGADLDKDDVAAILAGDEKRFGRALERELSGDWPEEVERGVELLGWMVGKGYLEVKVAFRVHTDTGEPLPPGSVEDGYVHEKWGVFGDEEGSRLVITGSLNESATAFIRNAENITVSCNWWGAKDAERVENAEREFEALWNDESRAVRVLTLPDAVRQRLIRIGERADLPREVDGSSAAPVEVEPPSVLERLQFAVIRDAPRMRNGRYVGLITAPVEPWPHQEIVARRLVDTWPYNYLLCDEVGLGKTIEAGLALRALQLSGVAKRILIGAPASLTRQWQREMASKFLMRFALVRSGKCEFIHPYPEETAERRLYEHDLSIISTALMTRKQRQQELANADPFDAVLIDEAHYARKQYSGQDPYRTAPKSSGLLYSTIERHLLTKAQALWLATATPMQIELLEVADLVRLTERAGAFLFDPGLMREFYGILGRLAQDSRLQEVEWKFLYRVVTSLKETDPLLWDYLHRLVVDSRSRNAVRLWVERGVAPRGVQSRNLRRFVFAAAPLSRVMMRHTRGLLEIYERNGELGANLARRRILPVPRIRMNEQEARAYRELEDYCAELKRQLDRGRSDKNTRNVLGFYLGFLRLRFASSLLAIRQTLERRRKRVLATLEDIERQFPDTVEVDWRELLEETEEDDDSRVVTSLLKDRAAEDLQWEARHLATMLENLRDLTGPSSKMHELLRVLDKRRDPRTHRVEQTVIFTRFYDTLTDIVEKLRAADPHMLIGTYSGQGKGGQFVDPSNHRLVGVGREVVKQKFMRREIDILVCTDAAAEGLNLQTADLIINFDQPWNPMKVEQRIGRIDRIGQRHREIFVLNLCYVDSAEQIVYDRLLNRLQAAGMVVGQQQISLLPVTIEEFQELADGKLDVKTLEARAVIRLENQKQREASMQVPPQDLYAIYQRLSAEFREVEVPVTLDVIERIIAESDYLRRMGMVTHRTEQGCFFEFGDGIPEVPDSALLTTSRALYEEGVPGSGAVARFASYGEPAFDGLLEHFERFELPPCVRRIAVTDDMLGTERVGYLVAVPGEDKPKIVHSLNELRGLQIDTERKISDAECAGAEKELLSVIRDEAARLTGTKRIEQRNIQAGRAQEVLSLMVGLGVLDARMRYGGNKENFWALVVEVSQLLEQRREIVVDLKPLGTLQRIRPFALFDCDPPEIGDSANFTAPRFLARTAVERLCRIADNLKVKKSELKPETVFDRVRRQIDTIEL